MVETLSFKHLILPQEHPPHTELLPLQPLPVTALKNAKFERLYPFSHFNPIQTQTFHVLHHTDSNVLVGAPTGSGKTIMAELAALKVFRDTPHLKVVYIAPLKALVRERMKDWTKKFVLKLDKKMVELTGDYTPGTSHYRPSNHNRLFAHENACRDVHRFATASIGRRHYDHTREVGRYLS
jgi:activating signal cointegrator complex subunit 3